MSADIEATNKYGKTSLHIACIRGDSDIFKVLLNNNANIEAVDENGDSPLHLLVQFGYINLIKYLHFSKNISNLCRVINKAGKRPVELANNIKIKQFLKVIQKAFCDDKGEHTPKLFMHMSKNE